MDSINYLGKADFPISSQTMEMLQGMTQLAGALAILGGPNYILTGCNESGAGVVSPGIIVIGGQPYTFLGGNKKAKITIQEIKETLIAFGNEYPEARTKRAVVFSDTGQYVWADFERVPTNLELKTLFQSIKGDAPGTVKMWAGQVSKIPAGYKLCDGTEILINDYPELFDILGVSFGGNGISSFKLPDLRGRFIVGLDTSDPDYNEINSSKKGGSKTATLVEANVPPHKHIIPWGENVTTEWNPPWGYAQDYMGNRRGSDGNDNDNSWAYTSPVGDSVPFDIRPPYFTLAYIIKVTA